MTSPIRQLVISNEAYEGEGEKRDGWCGGQAQGAYLGCPRREPCMLGFNELKDQGRGLRSVECTRADSLVVTRARGMHCAKESHRQ